MYYSIRKGTIVRHTRREGKDIETEMDTRTLQCQACQWTGKMLGRAREQPELCICGGRLLVTA